MRNQLIEDIWISQKQNEKLPPKADLSGVRNQLAEDIMNSISSTDDIEY